MAFTNKFKKITVGTFVQFSYSPKHLDVLTFFDRKPLGLFLGYDSERKLLHFINFHWITKAQRKKVIAIVKSVVGIGEDGWEFGKPMPINLYKLLKRRYPISILGYRTYFSNRMRNQSFPAWQWSPEDIEKKVINTDTAKIIGVTPEQIQKLAIKALRSRGDTRKRQAKARSKSRRR